MADGVAGCLGGRNRGGGAQEVRVPGEVRPRPVRVAERVGPAPGAAGAPETLTTRTVWASAGEPGGAYVLKSEGAYPDHPLGAAEIDMEILDTARTLTAAGHTLTCLVSRFSQTYGDEMMIQRGEVVTSGEVPGRLVSSRFAQAHEGGGGRRGSSNTSTLTAFHAVRKD